MESAEVRLFQTYCCLKPTFSDMLLPSETMELPTLMVGIYAHVLKKVLKMGKQECFYLNTQHPTCQ